MLNWSLKSEFGVPVMPRFEKAPGPGALGAVLAGDGTECLIGSCHAMFSVKSAMFNMELIDDKRFELSCSPGNDGIVSVSENDLLRDGHKKDEGEKDGWRSVKGTAIDVSGARRFSSVREDGGEWA